MTSSTLWEQYVASAGADAAALAAARDRERLSSLGQLAFRIGLSSLLLGADDVGRLALAVERAIDRIAGGAVDDAALADLGAAIATLHEAFVQLASADASGAR